MQGVENGTSRVAKVFKVVGGGGLYMEYRARHSYIHCRR